MQFKYFEHPDKFAVWLESPTRCEYCQMEKRCFNGTRFHGEMKVNAICEECLLGGKLRATDIYTCEGDIEELQEQLHRRKPEKSVRAVIQRADEITDNLERTTPQIFTWQQWYWPCDGGDYCTFIGYGSRAFYDQLAPDGDGEEFFKDSLYHTVEDLSDVDELWEESMPELFVDSMAAAKMNETLFYVFKSQKSERIFTVWDRR